MKRKYIVVEEWLEGFDMTGFKLLRDARKYQSTLKKSYLLKDFFIVRKI